MLGRMTAVCALFYSIYVVHKEVCRFLYFSWHVIRTLCWVCFQAFLLVAVSVIILVLSGCCLKKWEERTRKPVAVAAPETHEHALRARVHSVSGKHQTEEFPITIIPQALVEGFERWRDNTAEQKNMKAKAALVEGFERWRDNTAEQKNMKAKALKVKPARHARKWTAKRTAWVTQ